MCVCVCVCVCVLVTLLCPTLCDSKTVTSQAPLSMEFSRQEYWCGLPFPSPGDLPNPGLLDCRWIHYCLNSFLFPLATVITVRVYL